MRSYGTCAISPCRRPARRSWEQQRRPIEGEQVLARFEDEQAPVDIRGDLRFRYAWPEPCRRHGEDVVLAGHEVGYGGRFAVLVESELPEVSVA